MCYDLGSRYRMKKRIFESKCDKGIGGWKNMQNEEIYNFIFYQTLL
jgi:hypothetical protein